MCVHEDVKGVQTVVEVVEMLQQHTVSYSSEISETVHTYVSTLAMDGCNTKLTRSCGQSSASTTAVGLSCSKFQAPNTFGRVPEGALSSDQSSPVHLASPSLWDRCLGGAG